MPARMASRGDPNQQASKPSTTVFFALSVPAVRLAMSKMGTASASAGVTPLTGIFSGATPDLLS